VGFLILGIAMKSLSFSAGLLAVALVSCSVAAQAASTPANQDVLHFHTSLPKKSSDALFSYTAEWRVDQGEVFRSTGLSFLNAAKLDSSATAASVAKKLVIGFKDGLMALDPGWRGVTITQPDNQADITLANKAGYSLTTVTVRDYTNQALVFDVGQQPFATTGVEVALDLVLAADVEYIEGFSHVKGQTASQGTIELRIDDQKPIQLVTDGKTTQALESELQQHLTGALLSPTPLYPSMVSTDTRNNKPFDGSEVQLNHLAAHRISLDINDPSLGVLAKFKYQDDNRSNSVIEPRFMLGALLVVSVGLVVLFWLRGRKKAE
jgi:hypothetical protein